MSKKLEELFDLPQAEPEETLEPETETVTEETKQIVTLEAMNNLDKIDSALPAIKGLEASDVEMDEIAALAINSYKDLIDLGMNVEARVGSEIFSSASQFLGHAITAKNSKLNRKLKMIELQLKKAKLDIDTGDEDSSQSSGKMLDRNELLAEVLKMNKEDKKS